MYEWTVGVRGVELLYVILSDIISVAVYDSKSDRVMICDYIYFLSMERYMEAMERLTLNQRISIWTLKVSCGCNEFALPPSAMIMTAEHAALDTVLWY